MYHDSYHLMSIVNIDSNGSIFSFNLTSFTAATFLLNMNLGLIIQDITNTILLWMTEKVANITRVNSARLMADRFINTDFFFKLAPRNGR